MKRFLSAFLLTLSLAAQAGLPPTSSKISGESVYSTTFKTDFGTFKGTRSGTTLTLNSIGAGAGDSLVLGGTKAASAVLDVQSTTQGVLPPRMTTAQMNAISSPATGLTIYNTDVNSLASWNGTTWNYGFGSLNGDTVYSAKVSSAGVVSGENKTEFIVGNCTGSSPYTCDISSANFTVAPNCIAGVSLASNAIARVESVSATSVVIRTLSTAPATANSDFTLSCQKSGNDYTLAQNTSAWVQANSNPIATTTVLSAQISASGVVSGESKDFINGNCAVSGNRRTCTYNTNLRDGINPLAFPMNCNATPMSAGIVNDSILGYKLGNTSTGFAFDGGSSAQDFSVICEKTFSDYDLAHSPFIIGTFAGTPKVPGYAGSVDTFSFSYGTTNENTVCSANPCSYLDQIGTAVTQVGWSSAGVYPVIFSKTYTKIKCTGNAHAPSVANTWALDIKGSNTNTVTIATASVGGMTNTVGTFSCQGTY